MTTQPSEAGTGRVLVVSCEHATNAVPAEYTSLFAGQDEILASHRGWDPGAATIAVRFAEAVGVRPHLTEATRLLVEPNRSRHHRGLFSEFTKGLPTAEKIAIQERYYDRYRDAVERDIATHIAAGQTVLHVLVHTFTPMLQGEERTADVGLLYDPARPEERRVAAAWHVAFQAGAPELRIRRNYPYRGTHDGFEVHLRRRFPGDASRYVGLTIEVNQALAAHDEDARRLADQAAQSLRWAADLPRPQ